MKDPPVALFGLYEGLVILELQSPCYGNPITTDLTLYHYNALLLCFSLYTTLCVILNDALETLLSYFNLFLVPFVMFLCDFKLFKILTQKHKCLRLEELSFKLEKEKRS